MELADVRVEVDKVRATTDPHGRFAFQKVAPGRHWISAHNESRACGGGTYALVTAGQEFSGVEVCLKLGEPSLQESLMRVGN